ncbi:hypothetical protein F4804DRAFT_322522 [Jackrogersella minutella]|nr:hypothetical protein F4804DRAFT_322522 [Jackrogersella minutella]
MNLSYHLAYNSGFSDTQETQTTSCCLPLGRVDAWVDGGVDTYQKQAQVEAADDLTLLAGVALDREGEESQESISHSSNKPPRLESKKERNRKAANKCRQKSKANIELLKDRERRLSQENKELKSTVYGLRTEVLYLKNEVLMHGANCDYEPIQNYLTRVANGLADRSSP